MILIVRSLCISLALGTIDSCIPGGWYLVSNLLRNDNLDLDVVVNSKHLKIIPEKINLATNGEQMKTEYQSDSLKKR